MRLIDADALMQNIPNEEMIAKMAVAHAPSIDIVRCAVCKHRTDSKAKSFCEKWLREVDADVFCSYGRKGVANDR